MFFFFFQAEDGIRDKLVTGVQTCALPILGQILEAELGGVVEAHEFCFDFNAVALVFDFSFAAGNLHQFGALKIDHGGAAGAAVIHRFGGARNIFDGAGGRWRLADRWRSKGAKNSSEREKSRCDFHVKAPRSPLKAIPFRRPLCGSDEHNDIAPRWNECSDCLKGLDVVSYL